MTTNIVTMLSPDVQRKFHRNAHWALAGSIIYETLKVTHCFLLMQVLAPQLFGLVGSLLAILYFATYVVDLGATNSIPPFLHMFTQNRFTFRTFLLRYSLAPHLPLVLIGALLTTLFVKARFVMCPAYGIIGILVVAEAIRSFLRFFLHITFQARHVVIVELILFIVVYLGGIWGPFCCDWYMTGRYELTVNRIFIPHLIDSLLAVVVFVLFTYRYYRRLPVGDVALHVLPTGITRRLIVTRLFNYVLRVGRNLFTGNFLTPLFAVKFGLAAAGLFYFAGVAVNALQAVVKAIVGYSGNALLATVKNSGQHAKKEAFELLYQKFVTVVFPIFIFFGVNFRALLYVGHTETVSTYILSVLVLYLIISCADFFFVLYEQFYIIEEAADKLCLFKFLECAIFYGLISSPVVSSPAITLVGLLGIRGVTLFIITTDAYYRWKIVPRIYSRLGYLGMWFVGSVGCALVVTRWMQ